jgi:hypothetical protein
MIPKLPAVWIPDVMFTKFVHSTLYQVTEPIAASGDAYKRIQKTLVSNLSWIRANLSDFYWLT